MSANFTRGPWQAYNAGATIGTIEDCNGIDVIADLRFIKEESKHNASLISAAPDMFQALQACLDYLLLDSMMEEDAAPEIEKIRAAISKAKGEA